MQLMLAISFNLPLPIHVFRSYFIHRHQHVKLATRITKLIFIGGDYIFQFHYVPVADKAEIIHSLANWMPLPLITQGHTTHTHTYIYIYIYI